MWNMLSFMEYLIFGLLVMILLELSGIHDSVKKMSGDETNDTFTWFAKLAGILIGFAIVVILANII